METRLNIVSPDISKIGNLSLTRLRVEASSEVFPPESAIEIE